MFEKIEQEEAIGFEAPFLEKEVHDVLSSFNGDKALWSDGFSLIFWRFVWKFVKGETLILSAEFHYWVA